MRWLFVFLCSISLLSAQEYEVKLGTQESGSRLFLCDVKLKAAVFKKDYLTQLIRVLKFDLKNSGYFDLSSQKQLQMQSEKTENKWKQISFAVLPIAEKTDLYLEFWNFYHDLLQRQAVKKTVKVNLTGSLAIDRRKVHHLANDFMQKATGRKSVFENRILYSVRTKKNEKEWLSEIWIADWDGQNARRVTFENSYCVHPLFLSANTFLYVSYKSGFPKIYTASLDNPKNTQPLISLRGNQLLPALDRQRKQLAFISDAAGRPDLFLQPLNRLFTFQKPIQLFSFPRATQASSTFSPDSKKLAFVSDKDGTPRIYWIDLTDALKSRKRPKANLITIKNRGNVSPCWSSDGKKIAYSSRTDGIRQIWLYDFETKEEQQLTFDKKNKENPNFALDNLHVIYNTEDKEEAELYIIDVKTKKPQKISDGSGRKRFAVFEQN